MSSRMIEQVRGTVDSIQSDRENAHETEILHESENAGETNLGQVRPGTTEKSQIPPEVAERMAAEESLSYDQLFELLKNKRRRRVLQHLLDVDDEITLDVIAEQIAAEENGKEVKQITSQERKRVYVGLYQCHLPKMDDWGAISYNKPRGKISTAENTELFRHYLPEETDADERRWSEYGSRLPLILAVLFTTALLLGAVALTSVL